MELATKIHIKDILDGKFTPGQGYESGTLKTTDGKEIKKIHILATIVEKFVAEDKGFASITLDDATETIKVKVFKEHVAKIEPRKVGDIIDVMGVLREYEGEVYVMPDFIKIIDDPNWEILRNLELDKRTLQKANENTALGAARVEIDLGPIILEKVGAGRIAIKELINDLKEHEEENVLGKVRELMMKGDLYEPKPGVIKAV
ncbi:MAG: OB-fold nucleic acid binding domain-containing protein [archaeon]